MINFNFKASDIEKESTSIFEQYYNILGSKPKNPKIIESGKTIFIITLSITTIFVLVLYFLNTQDTK